MEKWKSIGHLIVSEDKHETDNLAIALASYFDARCDKPDDSVIDAETGWSEWVMEKTDAVLDKIDNERDGLQAEVKRLREANEILLHAIKVLNMAVKDADALKESEVV